MKKGYRYTTAVAGSLIATFIFASISYAATINVTTKLDGSSGDFFDLTGSTLEVGSLKVGEQGIGGVTFFNGSIINNTTDTYGNDLPVTVSDNLRVDGSIQRGHNQSGDTWGVKIDDDATVFGDLNATGASHISGNVRIDGQIQRGHNLPSDQWGVEINDDLTVFGTSLTVDSRNVLDEIDNKVSKTNPTYDTITSIINIQGHEFNPLDTTIDAVYSTSAIGALTTGSIFSAPVQLPEGAVVTNVEATFVDNDGAQDIVLSLKKNTFTSGDSAADVTKQIDMSTITSSGATATVQVLSDGSISSSTVDNSAAFYTAILSLPEDIATMQFMNMRITYTFTKPY